MEVRPAAEADIPPLMPLMRGYCDFYEANPSDAGLADMAIALIAATDDQGMLLVAEGDGGEVIGFAAVGWKWSSLRGARRRSGILPAWKFAPPPRPTSRR